MATDSLKSRVMRASVWAALSEVAVRLISPVVFLVVAPFLSPSDFGVAAAALLVITFSQILWDAGLSRAIVQMRDEDEAVSSSAIWVNLALALVVYLAVFALAPLIARSFQDLRITAAIRVQGLQILAMALGGIQRARLQRQMNFRALFWIRLITAAVPGGASVPLAIAGGGYWALVAGALIGSAAETVTLWRLARTRLLFRFDVARLRPILPFAAWSMLEAALGWLIANVDAAVVGHYLGSDRLGLFRAASTLVSSAFALAMSPLMSVAFTALSRLQDQPEPLRAAFLKMYRCAVAVALPLGASLFALQTPLEHLVFGAKWAGVAVPIGAMALASGLGWTVGLFPEAYRARGRPDVNSKIVAAALFYYVPAFVVGVHYGFAAFLAARVLCAISAIPIHLLVGRAVLGLPVRVSLPPLIWMAAGSLVLAIIVGPLSLRAAPGGGLPVGLALFSAAAVVTMGIVLALERDTLRVFAELVAELRARRAPATRSPVR